MTFYQELQLNQAGSKNLIAGLDKPKDKFVHILIFILKVVLNLVFCMGLVLLSGVVFGFENCIAGLVLVLGITVFRFTDLDIHATHSIGAIYLIFGIFAVCPKLANLVPVGYAFCINAVSILFIVIFGCHNVKWSNHSTLVLSYLLLYGSDVSGISYIKRLLCILLGATLTAAVLYRNRRKTRFDCSFKNFFTDFKLSDERTRWQIKIALCVSGAVLVSTLLGFAKPVWAGIAAAAVTVPQGLIQARVESRIRGNVLGCLLIVVFCAVLPESFIFYFGMIGGFAAGFCARYEGQTAWNSFSALSASISVLGVKDVLKYRLLNNISGALFALLFGKIIDEILLAINELIMRMKRRKSDI